MKKLLILALMFSYCMGLTAQQLWDVKSSNYEQLHLTLQSSDKLNVGTQQLYGQTFNTLKIDGFDESSTIGNPILPTLRKMIEMPICSGVEIEIITEEHLIIDGAEIGVSHNIMPKQVSVCKTASKNIDTLAYNAVVYNTNEYCGADVIEVSTIGIARNRNLGQLVFSPVKYNPISNQFLVYTNVEAKIKYIGVDREATERMMIHYSPVFGNGIETINKLGSKKDVTVVAPIRYLVISNPLFRGELDEFVYWKKRTGYMVDVVYTDDAEVGNTVNSIKAYIKGQYTNATPEKPAPTYLLFVGDVDQMPATEYTTTMWWWTETHVSDLDYACWTDGDKIPDCYYGRFSAQTVAQLTPQIEKTLLYERYEFPDPTFLDNALLVAGIDGGSSGDYGYTHADPAMDYAAKFYVNGDYGYNSIREYKNNVSINPNATNVTVSTNATTIAAALRGHYSEGAGWINYSAHGSETSWASPEFTVAQVAQMTNEKKCGLMIGNCCLTGKFNESTCFAESLLRKDNYCGAVAYIGGSNSTYWDEDFYWAIGIRNSISGSMTQEYMPANLGVYDRIFHTHNEAYPQWGTTIGAMTFYGNMSVQNSSSSSDNKAYYWQIYHAFGDPSLMPWLTQANEMPFTFNGMDEGSMTLSVNAAPYAYVALTDSDTNLVAAAFADENGNATLNAQQPLTVGDYVIAATAQNYQPKIWNHHIYSASIDEANDINLAIYPNPASEKINIKVNRECSVDVYGTNGVRYMKYSISTGDNMIDISNLPKGVYVIQINAGGTNSLTKSFIKR